MEDPMDVDTLIDAYVQDVAQLLPRKQRNDVALELRELLREDLQSRAEAQGRALDADIALEGLRAFGAPKEVAARYFEPRTIIPPTETRRFLFAAIIGIAVLIALSPLGNPPPQSGDLGEAIFIWLGVLVTYFGLQGIVQRRKRAPQSWVPRGRDNVNRLVPISFIVLIFVGIVAYGAPGWLFSQITRGGTLSATLDYDPAFYSSRLPVLFALWLCQAVLLAVLAVRGRWNPWLRRVDVGLGVAVIAVLIWFVAAGDMFKSPALNKAAPNLISTIVLFLLIDLGVKLYRGLGNLPSGGERHSLSGKRPVGQ
jgi:hypothetical protein